MQLKTIALLLLLANNCLAQRPNYQEGDTLKVFTLGGLKLREGIGLSSKVIGSMKLGSKVVVLDHFEGAQKYFQTIEGFSGHWIQVQYDTLIGYAFDGFLSALPMPNTTPIKKEIQKRTPEELEEDESYQGQALGTTLEKYIQSEFQVICEPVEYYNGYDGEGFHFLKIQKISKGFTKIRHQGWEGHGIELLMPNVRLSEIKNLIILLANESGIDDKLFEQLKSILKNISEVRMPKQEILTLPMFWISLKFYPNENNELNWSIEFSSATS